VVYDKLFDPDEPGVLSSTWGAGSRIDMAVGCKIIEAIESQGLLRNAQKQGENLLRGLGELVGSGDVIDVRGIGLMIGIELNQKSTRDRIVRILFKNGLLVLPAGKRSIRIMPPLIITADEIDNGLSILHDAFGRRIK
ncbi:MAG TPA: aminotransferase class III-fold pyridoxal phosphate-dependent enzyme, partial [Nitrososphaeraceae archaeon]|nr:aminotransferase class III-fold pyridoxal phosphate-dependent enzyme [Nitrososphaeraceae archaeon]